MTTEQTQSIVAGHRYFTPAGHEAEIVEAPIAAGLADGEYEARYIKADGHPGLQGLYVTERFLRRHCNRSDNV